MANTCCHAAPRHCRSLSGSDHRILAAPTWVIRACWNPDDCPEHLLPYLAQAWSVDEWDPAWPVAQRRQVIKDAPAFHKIKGTPEAIQRALSALSIGAIVREWFEYGGSPYRFKIAITLAQGAAWTSASARLVWRTALANKNVRSKASLSSRPRQRHAGLCRHRDPRPLGHRQLHRPRHRDHRPERLRLRRRHYPFPHHPQHRHHVRSGHAAIFFTRYTERSGQGRGRYRQRLSGQHHAPRGRRWQRRAGHTP
ncbi:MAG: phage tail protein I [Hyphomicrobium sp.]|nr:phage tail protein I [Hyphomicrobium sp.]